MGYIGIVASITKTSSKSIGLITLCVVSLEFFIFPRVLPRVLDTWENVRKNVRKKARKTRENYPTRVNDSILHYAFGENASLLHLVLAFWNV